MIRERYLFLMQPTWTYTNAPATHTSVFEGNASVATTLVIEISHFASSLGRASLLNNCRTSLLNSARSKSSRNKPDQSDLRLGY